jgi:RNA polymerase sigma-70 factor (ECF subfamily)
VECSTPRAEEAQESLLPKSEKEWSSDAELVSAILSGSREHFDLLYDAYFPRVYRFALKRLGDTAEAEDVAQEVFFTVFNVLESYQGTAPLLIWIFGITRNTVNRRFRRVRPRIESLDASNAREIAGGEPPTDRAVEARRMLKLCESNIANALGKSEDAIKANLYRMRRSIAQSAPGLESVLGSN